MRINRFWVIFVFAYPALLSWGDNEQRKRKTVVCYFINARLTGYPTPTTPDQVVDQASKVIIK
jgi:hypothetical protein